MLAAARGNSGIVTRVWHPEAQEAFIDTGNGVNAEVLVGNPAYQLSSGDIVAL